MYTKFRLNQTAHSKVTQKLSFNYNSNTIYSIFKAKLKAVVIGVGDKKSVSKREGHIDLRLAIIPVFKIFEK